MRPCSFELKRRGVYEVTIGTKEFMHKLVYMGMGVDCIFAGSLSTLFVGRIPLVELASAFELKAIDDTTIRNVAARYETLPQRMDASYALGEV